MRKLTTLLFSALFTMQVGAASLEYPRTVFPSGRSPDTIMLPKSTDNDTYQEVHAYQNAIRAYNAFIEPGEDVNINRIAVVNKDSCQVYTADTLIKTGAGVAARIAFMSGTATTAILYDNTAASGTKIYDNSAIGVTPTTGFMPPPIPIGGAFGTGLYLDVGGTSPVVMVCAL